MLLKVNSKWYNKNKNVPTLLKKCVEETGTWEERVKRS